VQGIARIDSFSAWFDGNTPDNAVTTMIWRSERIEAKQLVNCLTEDHDVDKIELQADENIFIDSSSVNVRFFGD